MGHGGRRDDNLSSECPQETDFLDAHLVGHGKNALVALDRGSDCKSQSRVSRRRFDNRASRFDSSFLLSLFNDPDSNPVLDRPAGIEILHFGKNRRLHPRKIERKKKNRERKREPLLQVERNASTKK